MEFAFTGEAPIGSECRRVFLAEAEGAAMCLATFAADPDLAVHEIRKHNKRMRGVLLLARPVLDQGELSRANRLVRDAARRFSGPRDALVRLETCDKLLERFGRKALGTSFGAVKEALAERHRDALGDESLPDRIDAARRDFAEAAAMLSPWPWERVTLDIVFSGFVSNYRLGMQLYESARSSRDPHECHEWRKRTKYLSFHHHLLTFLDPGVFAPRALLAEELASWLGEHHDLAVLEETFARHAELGIGKKSAAVLIRLCEERRSELEKEAFERGGVVYLDRPETLRGRLTGAAAALA